MNIKILVAAIAIAATDGSSRSIRLWQSEIPHDPATPYNRECKESNCIQRRSKQRRT